jgi:uncharacterized protein DUF1580
MMKLIPFEKIARRLPSVTGANHIHQSTVLRWAMHGVKRKGVRIRLQAVKMGGRWMTSWKWLKEFFRATTGEPITFTSPAEERRENNRIAAELKRRGMM